MTASLFNQKLIQTDILAAVQQDTICLFPVTPGSSRLLIIAFHIFRHIEMNDKPHIGFINPHSKRIGCDHDGFSVIDEIILIIHTLCIAQTGMIACCRKAIGA